MAWLLLLLCVLTITEVLIAYLSRPWLKPSAFISALLLISDSVLIIGLRPAVWTLVVTYYSLFRLINLLKLIDGRKQQSYLRSTFVRSSFVLLGLQAVVVGVYYLFNELNLSNRNDWLILSYLILAISFAMAVSFRRSWLKTRPEIKSLNLPEDKLPTVTVAIPARNETLDLEQCLDSLTVSNYPKLEIVVLDDCSVEKRTPEIIRQFAQKGVIFLQGTPPDDSWTPKNYAYEQLSKEANGEIIIFCGVDIRFDPRTIRQMVELKIQKQKSMLSFMPLNSPTRYSLKSLLVQPMRYLWELGLPRRSLNRPPVLSSCWLIERQLLTSFGSFKAVSRSILPERYFARKATENNDGYSFNAIGNIIGLRSVKSFNEQRSTAIRTKYPLLKQRLEYVSVLILVQVAVFIAPIGLVLYGLISQQWQLFTTALISLITSRIVFYKIVTLSFNKSLYYALLLLPTAIIYDIALNLYSMWGYEFSEIYWKGRNVCVPVMQLVKSLD